MNQIRLAIRTGIDDGHPTSLKAAAQNKWHVISMKNDWKTIFPQ